MSDDYQVIVAPAPQEFFVTFPEPPVAQVIVSPTDPLAQAALLSHINSETPHPAYDDLPSMTLLFENGIL